jgi:hypothetical protein
MLKNFWDNEEKLILWLLLSLEQDIISSQLYEYAWFFHFYALPSFTEEGKDHGRRNYKDTNL